MTKEQGGKKAYRELIIATFAGLCMLAEAGSVQDKTSI